MSSEVIEDSDDRNQIIPYVVAEKDIVILRFVPMNALSVLRLQDDIADEVHSELKGESLALITRKQDDGTKQFFSVRKPKKTDDRNVGMVDSTIELFNCVTQSVRSVNVKVEMNYFENVKHDHFASLTSDNKLLFGGMTRNAGRELFNLHLSAETSHGRKFQDVWIYQYPLIAYRPLERNFVRLCNTIRPDMPQSQLDLGHHHMKAFVEGAYMLSRY